MADEHEWLRIEEFAKEIGVPVATVYQWRSRGIGPRGAKFGKHVRLRRADVDAWVESHMDDPRPAA